MRGNTPPQLKNPGVLILPEDTPVGEYVVIRLLSCFTDNDLLVFNWGHVLFCGCR